MSHDDPDGMQVAGAGSLLQDMVHESGMASWIDNLGLNGHVDKAIFLSNSEDADGLQLDADSTSLLMQPRGGSAHDDTSAGASSRGKRGGDLADSPGPSKRPARNLYYGDTVDLSSHEAIQGMLHLDGDKEGSASNIASPAAKSRANSHHSHPLQADSQEHGASRFLSVVATTVHDTDNPPHSPAENDHVTHTPSSSGPR